MNRADLLAFPPTRIVRRRPRMAKTSAKRPTVVPQTKRPIVIVMTGLVMIVRCAVPPALYVLAGAGVLRVLGF